MSDKYKTIVVRVDANRLMGIGHAMRCIAVSEQLIAKGHHVIFAMHEVPSALLNRLERTKVEVLHLAKTENNPHSLYKIVQDTTAQAVILDGYHIENDYERCLKEHSAKVLRFDDYMPGVKCDANIIVNASLHANPAIYSDWAPNSRLLLGPQYIAFRSDMISAYINLVDKKLDNETLTGANLNTSILINFGGSDHLDLTIETASAIAQLLPEAKIEAVTGAAYPNPERISALGIKTLTHHHNTDNLAEVMQRARMAISAGGLTVTELALFRIPTILAITAQNQIKGAHVSWCHTILPNDTNGEINTSEILKKIIVETERLWNLHDERTQIVNRIPTDLDIHGARRIAEALIGESF